MINRRAFLWGATALGCSQGLAACGVQSQDGLRVHLLKNTVPPQLLTQFRQTISPAPRLSFTPATQLSQLFQQLQTWHQRTTATNSKPASPSNPSWLQLPLTGSRSTPNAPDLVALGDYWLTATIQQNLIQPLNVAELQNWSQLPQRWQTFVTRDRQGQLDPKGEVWAAPYRWGTTVIAYRADKFAEQGWAPPTDWSDLWRPELRDRISLLDQAREVIGLTLKKLGKSYNTTDLRAIAELKRELQSLHQQTKLYSSTSYLQPLILGDTWLAVGWSTDVLSTLKSNRQIAAVVPQSGTRIWSELWVQPSEPSTATRSPRNITLADQWIDFCLQPKTAIELSVLGQAVSPLLGTGDRASLPAALQAQSIRLPPATVVDKSELLEPLPPKALEQYRELWVAMRQGTLLR